MPSPSSPWRLPDGRERVALYPRPPALEPWARRIRVEVFGRLLAETTRSLRILETHHPPTVYLPPEAVDQRLIRPGEGRSFCEWKGLARYLDLVEPGAAGSAGIRRAALWQYLQPSAGYEALAGWFGVYPGRVDACWVDAERVQPQEGGFYAGWITADLDGPFKGDPAHPELI